MSLETERLILRRWQKSDSEPFHQMNSDPQVMEFLLKPLSREESDAFIARIETRFDESGFGLWAVESKATGELAGFTGLAIPKFETHFTPCVEVGWRLARKFWGQGLASEAARASLAYGFSETGLKEIVSFTVPANTRSIAVMERIGLKRDPSRDFMHPLIPDGHRLKAHVLYYVRKEE